jgi:DNA polymerase epsilon subunit 1
MAEAFQRNIIFPNKKKENYEKFYNGHLLDSETYIGGKVECINSGVYRADLPTKFKLDPQGYQSLIDNIDKVFHFIAEKEGGFDINNVANYDEVKTAIIEKLSKLKTAAESGPYDGLPLIYHLDVSAMYPNIILTNRLQPVAIVDDRM